MCGGGGEGGRQGELAGVEGTGGSEIEGVSLQVGLPIYRRYNVAYMPVNWPGTEPPPPIQTQLNRGERTN